MKIEIALLITSTLLLASCGPKIYYSRAEAQGGCAKKEHEPDTVYTVRAFNYGKWYCKNGELHDIKKRTRTVYVSPPPSSIDLVETGMSTDRVRSLIGKPNKIKQLGGNKVRWIWALPQCFNEQRKGVSSSYRGYACNVVFDKNKVVEYDRGNISVSSRQVKFN